MPVGWALRGADTVIVAVRAPRSSGDIDVLVVVTRVVDERLIGVSDTPSPGPGAHYA